MVIYDIESVECEMDSISNCRLVMLKKCEYLQKCMHNVSWSAIFLVFPIRHSFSSRAIGPTTQRVCVRKWASISKQP